MEVEHNLAIIVKGNPKYIRTHRMKRLAQVFYDEIRAILRAKGYTVEFDEGKAYTLPKVWAGVWVAHSRGIDRLRFAPKTVKTVALQTRDSEGEFDTNDERGFSALHYQLSEADRKALAALPNV